jgi:LysR family transcriptional regulator, glycine cleavage system transcriptional activator
VSRLTPPTPLLRAFEACSRHLSVSRAAEELNLTQSGVSRQLSQLEALLGIKLFFRVRRRLALTPAGAGYAGDIRAALAQIESATQTLLAHQGTGGTLTIAVSPTFGTRWLMPRMGSFRASRPSIIVNLVNYSARPVPLDFAAEHVDAAIFSSSDPGPGIIAHRLMREDLVPVCSPTLLAEGRLKSPEDLAAQTLLQHTTLPRLWHDWLKWTGVSGIDGQRGPELQHMAMVAEAAAAGLGVALLPRFLFADDIQSGRLAVTFDVQPYTPRSYFVVYPDKSPLIPALRDFRDWILGEAPQVARS